MSTPGHRVDPEFLRENLRRVLAGIRWPAARWEILAEADAWGVSGVLRHQLDPLPDGRYPSLDVLVEVLVARSLHGAPARPHRGPLPGGRPVAHRRVVPAPAPAAEPEPRRIPPAGPPDRSSPGHRVTRPAAG